jgi:putative SOS response-associated peptidase YedK
MPVILRDADEIERWMSAPMPEALLLQRPLPDGALKIVLRGEKQDGDGPELAAKTPEPPRQGALF